MQTAVVNIKVEPIIKKKAQKVVEELGLSLSGVINGYLHHLVRTKAVHFSLSEEPSEYMMQSLKEAEDDIKAGRVSPPFDNAKDAIAWLRNPKAKYANKIRQKV
ncbi:MAG: type II toxin-antitoxin system RelB/DinJ family antitoxin [Candidatus Daviesbacteria bacterium]|nr:type II toxin-antitoxin system RelB/DinJ family antitoxin [Candidatus Daviesbacteria bacterium]